MDGELVDAQQCTRYARSIHHTYQCHSSLSRKRLLFSLVELWVARVWGETKPIYWNQAWKGCTQIYLSLCTFMERYHRTNGSHRNCSHHNISSCTYHFVVAVRIIDSIFQLSNRENGITSVWEWIHGMNARQVVISCNFVDITIAGSKRRNMYVPSSRCFRCS